MRRIRKWKEIRYFWSVTSNGDMKEHGGNIENAFWMYGNYPIPVVILSNFSFLFFKS